MSNRIFSAFMLKKKKGNFSNKSLSTSKFNSTESRSKYNPKKDYFSLLTQMKKKKINAEIQPTLFHYFVKKNAQNLINIRLSYLAREEIEQILNTDRTNNQKNVSHKKSFVDFSFKNKNDISNKGSETPRVPINRLLKIKEKKKFLIKPIIKKKYIPMERRDSYKKFINKMNQNNYMKYSNSNSDYAHKIRTELYITQANEKEKIIKRANDKYLQYLKNKTEDENEAKDIVFTPDLELEKLRKKIQTILLKDYAEKPESFFDKFINKVNFLQEACKPPNIKNNLINLKYKDYGYDKMFGLQILNRISKNTLINLSNAKVRVQREKELKNKFLKEKQKIQNKYRYYKKLSRKTIYNSKEEIEKIIFKEYYIKQDDLEHILRKDKEIEDPEELELYRNYFEDKFETNREVFISDYKLKKTVFDLFNDNNL